MAPVPTSEPPFPGDEPERPTDSDADTAPQSDPAPNSTAAPTPHDPAEPDPVSESEYASDEWHRHMNRVWGDRLNQQMFDRLSDEEARAWEAEGLDELRRENTERMKAELARQDAQRREELLRDMRERRGSAHSAADDNLRRKLDALDRLGSRDPEEPTDPQ